MHVANGNLPSHLCFMQGLDVERLKALLLRLLSHSHVRIK